MLTLFKDPFFNDFDRLFNFYQDDSYFAPKVKVDKNDKNYELQMSLPGLTKDDLGIEVKDGLVTISHNKEEKSDNGYFVSNFTKTYTLPNDVNEDKISGEMKNGILVLKLPIDTKKTKPKLIELQ